MEKVYKSMGISGATGIIIGIVLIATGLATGVLSIITGARLLKNKKGLLF